MCPFTPSDICVLLFVCPVMMLSVKQIKNQRRLHLLPILFISSHSTECFYYFLLLFQVSLGFFSPHFSYSDMISSRGRAAKITTLLILKSVSKDREVHVEWGELALRVDLELRCFEKVSQ